MSDKAVEIRGEMLKAARSRLGWNQEEVASQVGCAVRSIANAEAGNIGAKLGRQIAEALGLRFESLLRSDADPLASLGGLMPLQPSLCIGRDDDIAVLLRRFEKDAEANKRIVHSITAVQGWPGVGKTTLAAELAHRQETKELFPEGVLWASLGQEPDVRRELAQWSRALREDAIASLDDATELSRRLVARLQKSRMLLIIDDVWQACHARQFLVGGPSCGILLTTRLLRVAEELTPSPAHQYHLDVLSETESLTLLKKLSPQSLQDAPDSCCELVRELEGLPLAIQVAGRLLHSESRLGSGAAKVNLLLSDIREGAKRILQQPVPVDMYDTIGGVLPMVTALLRLSTDVLDEPIRFRFAALSFYPPKPATFDIVGLTKVWEVSDEEASNTIAELLDRGLLEAAGEARVQCHSLLISHAATLAEELS